MWLSGMSRPAYTLLHTTTTEGEGSVPRIRITLEAALKCANMSGRELERRTSVHRDTIGKYRHNAVRIVSLDMLERFCAALGCELSDLLTDQPTTTVPQSSKRLAPVVQPTPVAPASPERQPKVAAWMSRPTLEEFQTLIARKKAGALRPGDAQRLADIMRYWPCWEMTDEEYDTWDAVRNGR